MTPIRETRTDLNASDRPENAAKTAPSWKWMATATAVCAVAPAAADAATIPLGIVYSDGAGSIQLDFGGDTSDDLSSELSRFSVGTTANSWNKVALKLKGKSGDGTATATASGSRSSEQVGSETGFTRYYVASALARIVPPPGAGATDTSFNSTSEGPTSAWAFKERAVPITFTDGNINFGVQTLGLLRIKAYGNAPGPSRIEVALEYDALTEPPTPAPIPEPATLSLLASGAAGLLAMRRRRKGA